MRAATWGRPYGGKRTRSVDSAKPGAGVEPHHLKFSAKSAPSGAEEIAEATQILRAGNFAEPLRRGPRKWGTGGKANMSAERSS